ncbi:hypothetical protein [Bosea sp. BK604]|uniref:hypothetical protein n=1 Tax=Bosea sp. BK604 TaxID=2512180 RepID=UPI00105348B5|nr:hypothetical protein [Bosea sp. BK604]TCR65679.1 hypothetical protein EV560_105442 [Bosea sp. BK604]
MGEAEQTVTTISEDEVDAVLAEANGDAREAIRMLLHDLAALAADAQRQVSNGYLRGFTTWKRVV